MAASGFIDEDGKKSSPVIPFRSKQRIILVVVSRGMLQHKPSVFFKEITLYDDLRKQINGFECIRGTGKNKIVFTSMILQKAKNIGPESFQIH
jgi:hypothetical protein